MNSDGTIGFGVSRVRKWKRGSTSLLMAMGFAAITGFCGCESTDAEAGNIAMEREENPLVDLSTIQLKARRAEILKRYGEIQREVELKAGLPMGVAIKDDRALLGELYREAHEIERELMRRFSRGDPDVTMEQVRASF